VDPAEAVIDGRAEVALLVEPTERYRDEFLAAEREFADAGGERIVGRHQEMINDFAAYVQYLQTEQGRAPTEPGLVATSVLWLIDGDAYVGRVNLRHQLTPRLRRLGGHIGYEIRPSRRGRGYGKLALALALERARGLGLRRVLLVCADENVASRRIIEDNWGALEGTFRVRERSESLRRYWIDLRYRNEESLS
jgi:predicted acetyltransferase